MSVKFGLLEIPRSTSDFLEHAQLVEELGIDWLGIAVLQSLHRDNYGESAFNRAYTKERSDHLRGGCTLSL